MTLRHNGLHVCVSDTHGLIPRVCNLARSYEAPMSPYAVYGYEPDQATRAAVAGHCQTYSFGDQVLCF